MKKMYLTRFQQFNEVAYTGSIDPRKLLRLADQTIEIGQVREDQRPLDKKHIQDIATHVAEDRGLLPASIIVGTKDKNKLVIETEKSSTGETLYYMMIPDTEEEFGDYVNTIDISDGQHRTFAFSDTYRMTGLKDSEIYEMPVTFYITPQLITRQNLFYTTNAKQKPVPQNLLMWLRDQLKLLSKPEETYLPLVRLLNTENISPLQGRIIMSAEKISKGYKAKEIVKIFDKAKIKEIGLITSQEVTNTQMTQILSDYLEGWEKRYQLDFQHPGKDTMTKISGLRYIFLLLPTFIELAVSEQKKFNVDFVVETIMELEEVKGVNPVENQTLFTVDALSFRGEGATVKRAEDDGKALKAFVANKKTSGFNPFA
ncbi:MAG: DGQHR domain-containing protein, partial [Lachnospiraceae bacterium]|nr:DGQHR domain-containing protein [Lachnospiraceae bacterium]